MILIFLRRPIIQRRNSSVRTPQFESPHPIHPYRARRSVIIKKRWKSCAVRVRRRRRAAASSLVPFRCRCHREPLSLLRVSRQLRKTGKTTKCPLLFIRPTLHWGLKIKTEANLMYLKLDCPPVSLFCSFCIHRVGPGPLFSRPPIFISVFR